MIKSVLNCIRKSSKVIHLKSLKPNVCIRGNALVSYITAPFNKNVNLNKISAHSNYQECYIIVKTLQDFGYDVDVIDWSDTSFIPKKKYRVFIDIHSNLERLHSFIPSDCIKILYATGSYWLFQNSSEYKRLMEFYDRNSVSLLPQRQVVPTRSIQYADSVIIIGNDQTVKTYPLKHTRVYKIPISSVVSFPFIKRNYDQVKCNFLWLGSSGAIHKGLDLVIEAFKEMPKFKLYICGNIEAEQDFYEYYRKAIDINDNIHYLGWVDVKSAEFLAVAKNCSALIYPSCAEGQAGSIATCMHAGLIPIISKYSGYDLSNDEGIILDSLTSKSIQNATSSFADTQNDKLRKMSKNIWLNALNNHSTRVYKGHLQTILKDILQ